MPTFTSSRSYDPCSLEQPSWARLEGAMLCGNGYLAVLSWDLMEHLLRSPQNDFKTQLTADTDCIDQRPWEF